MEIFNLIIAGGRDFNDYYFLEQSADEVLSEYSGKYTIQIVSGKCKTGADYHGEQYAKKRGYEIIPCPPDWVKYGKAAGPIRNKQMANIGNALLYFWDKKSRGTKDMIQQATDKGLKIYDRYYNLSTLQVPFR